MVQALRPSDGLATAAGIILLVSVVLFVRLALGFEFPIPWNDETAFISQAFEFSRTGSFYVYGLNSERTVMWMPPGFMLLLAGVYKVFGYSFDITRWVSCLLYLGCAATGLLILRQTLQGWHRSLGLLLMLLAFLSPYSLAVSNIARMESMYSLIFLLSLLAAVNKRYGLGLALVLLGATVHFNAVYFLLPYAVLVAWKILRRESLTLSSWELLALVLVTAALGIYALFVLQNLGGFLEDMRFQFAFKLGSPVMGGRSGWVLLLVCLCVPVLQLALHRRLTAESLLSLYGVSFIAMALNGHSMWYYFAFSIGFWLQALGVLASAVGTTAPLARRILQALAVLLVLPLAYYAHRETFEFEPLKPDLSMLRRDFLPAEELDKVRRFIHELPPGATVSFGYSGVEPYFFADFAAVGARWSGSAHSVTQVFPARTLDYRVFCDSSMYPRYLATFDWDGYPRQSRDTGCQLIRLESKNHAQD